MFHDICFHRRLVRHGHWTTGGARGIVRRTVGYLSIVFWRLSVSLVMPTCRHTAIHSLSHSRTRGCFAAAAPTPCRPAAHCSWPDRRRLYAIAVPARRDHGVRNLAPLNCLLQLVPAFSGPSHQRLSQTFCPRLLIRRSLVDSLPPTMLPPPAPSCGEQPAATGGPLPCLMPMPSLRLAPLHFPSDMDTENAPAPLECVLPPVSPAPSHHQNSRLSSMSIETLTSPLPLLSPTADLPSSSLVSVRLASSASSAASAEPTNEPLDFAPRPPSRIVWPSSSLPPMRIPVRQPAPQPTPTSPPETSQTAARRKRSRNPASPDAVPQKEQYRCPFPNCDKVSSEKSNLRAHQRCHTDEKPYSCIAEGCDKRFRWKSSLSYHQKSSHSSLRPYGCDCCDKRFLEARKLQLHLDWCPAVRHRNAEAAAASAAAAAAAAAAIPIHPSLPTSVINHNYRYYQHQQQHPQKPATIAEANMAAATTLASFGTRRT
jgi:hypothetical protein